ncbi:MAG: UDP-N-acetylglucosamine 2-epimerase [Candidatus Scalindua brodae]|uniref:UDP-N-acetylglucosamine 2-epimerase n=1 Tax=Candidatus Scalindua brodae TaxID=237368 RepID=A0A0B0EQ28_9BACT|nr:MAG: UDP-N-acetylglucosamine 2-epimerase [Candidatus Scalindua brodae]
MKIANIVGARPQFIKYFPISQAINRFNETCGNVFDDILIHTGQHYDYNMSKVFFDEFGMKMPEYHLEVGSGSHGEQTGQILQKVEDVLIKESPDIVLVYGDTNSTLGLHLLP